MMRPSMMRAALLALAGATACTTVQLSGVRGTVGREPAAPVRPGASPARAPGTPADPEWPTTPPGDLPGPASGTRYADERRVCRTTSVPRGWIAVAYVSVPGQCPARDGADSLATSSVLARHAGRPRGALLDVCADQPTPSGWERVRDEVEGADRCPGAAPAGSPTTRRIRRYR